MEKSSAAPDPDAYVRSLRGWRREAVEALRAAVKSSKGLEEAIKWGHLVYSSNGPVLLIRAEAERVLFGFWRGQRLAVIEPALKPGGKYEMATQVFTKGMPVDSALARRLAREAVALNQKLGDPTKVVRSSRKSR